jgi:hypothetical protein
MGKLVWDCGKVALSNPFSKPLNKLFGTVHYISGFFLRIVPYKAWLGLLKFGDTGSRRLAVSPIQGVCDSADITDTQSRRLRVSTIPGIYFHCQNRKGFNSRVREGNCAEQIYIKKRKNLSYCHVPFRNFFNGSNRTAS